MQGHKGGTILILVLCKVTRRIQFKFWYYTRSQGGYNFNFGIIQGHKGDTILILVLYKVTRRIQF